MTSILWDAFLLAFWQSGLVIGLVPFPGLRSQPAQIKAMISVALAVVLAPAAQRALSAAAPGDWLMLALSAGGRSLLLAGIVMGLNELYSAATSTWSVQTGLSYSSVLDPSKDSESTSLTTIVQLLFLLHLVGLNLHLELLALGLELERLVEIARPGVLFETLVREGKSILGHGLAWGLPYVALLLGVDIALALGSKLHEKFQSMMLANPLKQITLFLLLMLSLPFWAKDAGIPIATWILR